MSSPRLGDLSAIKLALMAKKVRGEAEAVLRADPIAVVGMGCRAPGGADDPARLWELLRTGTDAVREVPEDRWKSDDWFDPDPAAPGKTLTKWGGFLDRIDGFDAAYFGILPREAERMDPQQRAFLEVAMEALDDAGIAREGLAGSRTGVFIASYHNDYAALQYDDLDAIDARTLTGTLHSVLANRLSYFLDLRGPSLSIDTACSSSLVAVHLACQSLRTGESDLAVAGGVSLIVTPTLMVSLSKVGFMSPDGHCKTFDSGANGFVRGEGCGVVVLKRLADAIADEDRVLAVIRGSCVNQDGHSTLLAAPNGQAQQALIREALATAQLSPARIGFVEAHGTGTALGDPIEVEAIAATVGTPAAGEGPCFLGAAKANVGHLEAAAGVIGLIKTVLVLGHGAVPPQIGFKELNPHISLEGTRLKVPQTLTPWPRGQKPRCAAVSSFGVGGTNAHVILEESPALPPPEASARAGTRLLPLSAQSPEALRALAAIWQRFLPQAQSTIDDLARTAAARRTHYDHRLAVTGSTIEALGAALSRRLEESAPASAASGPPRVAFVFSGQGPQWYAMGRELLAEEPVFRDVLTECDRLFLPLAGWSLLAELAKSEESSRLDQTEVAQPALFSIQVALAALWKSWGLVPDAVVGHSIGELAALHVASVLSLAEAARIVWHRGHIMQQATGLGRMAQVALPADEAEALAKPFGPRLSVGAMNGPRSVVLSGETASLEQALATLSARGVGHRMLPVKYAFHSAQMAPFQTRLVETLGAVAWNPPAVPVYSTVSGRLAEQERFDAAYFGRNVRESVRFANAVVAMGRDGFDAFVEIGPHPVLSASITECLESGGEAKPVLASLRRTRPERDTMLEACARLYELGFTPSWNEIQPDGAVVPLPSYPWQHQRYWIRARPETKRVAGESIHPLLGREIEVAGSGLFAFDGDTDGVAGWAPDHRIFEHLILPAAAVLEALHAAAKRTLGGPCELDSFAMERPLFVPEPGEAAVRLQTVVTPGAAGEAELALYEAAEHSWQRIASAHARAHTPDAAGQNGTQDASATEPVDAGALYARFSALGVAFGPSFRLLSDIRRGDGVATASIELPPGLSSEAYPALHPVVLDAALQLCSIAAPRGSGGELPSDVFLPIGADRFALSDAAPQRVVAHAKVVATGAGSLSADITIEAGDAPVAVIHGLRFARAEPGALAPRRAALDSIYEIAWQPLEATPGPAATAPGNWLILADASGFGDRLADLLNASGKSCFLVRSGNKLERVSDKQWTASAAAPEHFREIVTEVGALEGVVHAFGLDVTPLEEPRAGSDEDALVVGSVVHLVQALVSGASASACALWLVSRGAEVVTFDEPGRSLRPRAAALRGLASVIAVEHPELSVRRVDLDTEHDADGGAAALVTELTAKDGSRLRTAALRRGQWWAPRLARRPGSAAEPKPMRAEVAQPGTLDGAELRPIARRALGIGEVRVRIGAAGLNFRDVLMTLGMYPGAPVPLGVECAGVVTEAGPSTGDFTPGTRVFGYAPGSLGTEVTVPAAFLAKIPDGLGDEPAAALPVAFLTAYYGLHRLAKLARGEHVLIHAAAGGVGLAAVQLAQRAGAVIFATAGSERKRGMLRELGVDYVMDSRSLAFADEIRQLTGGQGVHVVLNSLAGDFVQASFGLVGKGGCFLELGKRDVLTPEEATKRRPDVRYHLYDLGSEAEKDHSLLRPMLDDLLSALSKGEIRPLPIEVFPLDKLSEALRFMAQAKHVGKIVVRPTQASSAPLVSENATYLVTGGLGGVGFETARWLVEEGAKNLVLVGRRPPSQRIAESIRELEGKGAKVRVVSADVADASRMKSLFDDIAGTLPALRGVVHAAGSVDDAPLLHQTWARSQGVLSGKASGAWILHDLTRHLPLDFFILYSAAGVLLGSPGQGSYAAANAELDALARARRRLGLPALSVAWGAWADVGMAAELAARGPDVWAARGLGKITPATGFAALARLLRDGATYAAVMPITWSRFLAQLSPGADRTFFEGLGASVAPRPAATTGAAGAIVGTLRGAPAGQRRAQLLSYLTERALNVIGLDASTSVDPKIPFKEVGLDSLMAVELRNTLARAMAQPLPATLLFDYPTPDTLVDHLLRVLGFEAARTDRTAPKEPEKSARSEIAELSDEEAEALLLKELETGTLRRAEHG